MFPNRLIQEYIDMSQYTKMDKFDTLDEQIKEAQSLYHDEFCTLYPGMLEIVWFYFPTAKSKNIDTRSIKAIYYRKQCLKTDFCKTKQWGQSCTKIWWACDSKREFHKQSEHITWYNVVIDNGERTMKGFTNNNIDAFLAAIKPQLNEGTLIVNDFP